MNKKIIALYTLDEILGITGMGVALLWSAGRIDWWPAWAAIAVWFVCFTAMNIAVIQTNPDLMEERLNPPKSAKAWDRVIVSIIRLAELGRYITAGLDQRYGWTEGFPLATQIAAIAVCFLSYALYIWAMGSNAFFSQVVRIQSDRGHAVPICFASLRLCVSFISKNPFLFDRRSSAPICGSYLLRAFT